MDLVSLIMSLISGGVGGNIAGALMKDKSLGVLANSLAGVVGGGVGGTLLSYFGLVTTAMAEGKLDVGSILANIGTSGVGGAVVLLIVSFIKNAMKK